MLIIVITTIIINVSCIIHILAKNKLNIEQLILTNICSKHIETISATAYEQVKLHLRNNFKLYLSCPVDKY